MGGKACGKKGVSKDPRALGGKKATLSSALLLRARCGKRGTAGLNANNTSLYVQVLLARRGGYQEESGV